MIHVAGQSGFDLGQASKQSAQQAGKTDNRRQPGNDGKSPGWSGLSWRGFQGIPESVGAVLWCSFDAVSEAWPALVRKAGKGGQSWSQNMQRKRFIYMEISKYAPR